MSKVWSCDVLILGSGFAGSLTALILQRIGLHPLVVDKAVHPRFAIGESSTPVANMVLRDLARRYDLPRILPLAKWGTWQRTYPQLGCGLKRGFSYFQHLAGQPFQPGPRHETELLVAASADDDHSDTHWLRADVDQFLCQEARAAGIQVLEATTVSSLERTAGGWEVDAKTDEQPLKIRARFLIDGTGEAGILPRALRLHRRDQDLVTRSRTLFSHFRGVRDWQEIAEQLGAKTNDYPFPCDDAAQHHLLEDAWVWVLRFSNGVTSLGIVPDESHWPLDPSVPITAEWEQWLDRYPSLRDLLRDATIVDPPGKLLRTGRLQRCWSQAAGDGWALLPHTAGFIDPLHSTGIAHSLCGIERLADLLARHWNSDRLPDASCHYSESVLNELRHIDRIVAGCFLGFGNFPLFAAYSLLYFAAATDYEHRRCHDDAFRGAFLGADQPAFAELVRNAYRQLHALRRQQPTPAQSHEFAAQLVHDLQPFNRVGLGDPAAENMYHFTAAPQW